MPGGVLPDRLGTRIGFSGALLATFAAFRQVVIVMALLLGFAWYVQNFGNYSATCGRAGAAIVLLPWLHIAGLATLLGSGLNVLVEPHAAEGRNPGERAQPQPWLPPPALNSAQSSSCTRTR